MLTIAGGILLAIGILVAGGFILGLLGLALRDDGRRDYTPPPAPPAQPTRKLFNDGIVREWNETRGWIEVD